MSCRYFDSLLAKFEHLNPTQTSALVCNRLLQKFSDLGQICGGKLEWLDVGLHPWISLDLHLCAMERVGHKNAILTTRDMVTHWKSLGDVPLNV